MKQAARQTASTLGTALAISLALHALLLLQDAAPPADAGSAGTPGKAERLDARLRGDEEPTQSVAAPKRAQADAATILARTAPAEGARARATPARAAPAAGREQPFAPPPGHGSTSPTEARVPASAPDASAGGDGDGDGLRKYRIELAVAARRFRDYPTAARNAGIGGVAGVRLAFAAAGLAHSAELDSSSGNGLLDAAAVAMLDHAARATPLPARLRGRPFAVVIPVEFDPRTE